MSVSLSTMWWDDRTDPLATLARRARSLGLDQVTPNHRVGEEPFLRIRGDRQIPFQRLAPLILAQVQRALGVRPWCDERALAAGLVRLRTAGVLP